MPLKHKIEPGVEAVIRTLVDAGFEAYIVGGAVRDLMLDLAPKDYDLATSAHPEEIRNVFGRRRARIIGRRFRLVHVHGPHACYEVSTFRRQPSADERRGRPDDDGLVLWRDNEYGTLEDDALRRDFTVNALYFDAVGTRGIIDFVGGIGDLETGVVRTIGDPRIRLDEDPVRMLRALKLVGQYDFRLEPELAACIRQKVRQIELASITRLFEELLKILARDKSGAIIEACRDHGLLEHFWPMLDRQWDTATGVCSRRLLAARNQRLATGDYSSSKALALATVALPHVAASLGVPELDRPWEQTLETGNVMREAIREFFAPFPISRFFTVRMREIMQLTVRLAKEQHRKRLMHHPEYKYGRELLSLLVETSGWPRELLDEWPTHDAVPAVRPQDTVEEPPKRTPRRRPRGGRRRSKKAE